jgi:hypothetical protein
MTAAVSVTVDFERGEVVLGSRSVCLEPVGQPYRFRLTGGAAVRAVTFEERSRAVREALIAPDPPDALIAALRTLATDAAVDAATDAVVLALAGGSEDAPGFDECAVAAARVHGWDWTTLNQAPAIEVDRALASAPLQPEAGGWMRFVFAANDAAELDQLLSEMAERLLDRGIGRPRERQSGEAEPPPASPAKYSAAGAQPEIAKPVRSALHSPTPAGPPADPARIPASESPRFRVPGRPLDGSPARPPAPRPLPATPRVTAPGSQPAAPGAAAALRTKVLLNRLDASPAPESGAPRVRVRVIEEASYSAPPAVSAPRTASRVDSSTAAVAPPRSASSVEHPAASAFAWPSRAASTTLAPPLEPAAGLVPQSQPHSHPAPTAEQRDWLAEIARALAEECDLRGIDA